MSYIRRERERERETLCAGHDQCFTFFSPPDTQTRNRHGHTANVLKIDVKRTGKAKKAEKQIIYYGGATGGHKESITDEVGKRQGFDLPCFAQWNETTASKPSLIASSGAQVYRLDIGSLKWHKVEADGGPRRMYHTSVALSSATHSPIVVFGGLDEKHNPTNDVYMFEYVSKTWTKIETTGPAPPPRWYLAMDRLQHATKLVISFSDCVRMCVCARSRSLFLWTGDTRALSSTRRCMSPVATAGRSEAVPSLLATFGFWI